MKLKNKIAIAVLVCMIIGIALIAFSQKEAQKEEEKEQNESLSIQTVLDSLWDNYKLYSVETTQYEADRTKTSITVFNEKDIDKINKYLKKNLPEKDWENHEFDVIELSEKHDYEKPYSTKNIVDSLWDKFSVQSTHFVKNDENNEAGPEIFITVYVKKDINKIESYLEKHLSEKELEDYKIDVAYWKNRRGANP